MRTLVCGVGDFGALHAALVRAHEATELVGVVDVDAARAEQVAAGEVAAHTDLGRALDNLEPDAVIVATPEQAHREDAEAALAAGAHVLIEKPVAMSVDDVDTIEAAAARADRVVLPGHVSRFLPEVADVLADPRPPRHLAASRYVPAARRGPHGRVHPAWMAMVHDLDLIAALLPDRCRVSVAAAERTTPTGGPSPDVCAALLSVEGHATATVDTVWLLPHERQYIDASLRVAYDDEIVDVAVPGDGLRRVRADGEHRPSAAIDGRVGARPVGALASQLGHLADLRAGRAAPLVTLRDARRAGILADAVVHAAATHQLADVDLS